MGGGQVKFTPGHTQNTGVLWRCVMRLARRPQGAEIEEVSLAADVPMSVASSRMARMLKTGRLRKEKRPGESVKYFVKEPK
jgi:hypothetical protein